MRPARRFEISVGVSYALLVAALAVHVFALLHAFRAVLERVIEDGARP